jgi:Fe-S-cluster containining protein
MAKGTEKSSLLRRVFTDNKRVSIGRKKLGFEHPEKVRFKCLKCGICCGDTQERKRHILLLDEEAQDIAKTARKSIDDIASKVEENRAYAYEMKKDKTSGKCIFLNANRCTIYSKRPLICRFYPFGLETNQKQQNVFFFTNECPGIGKGTTMKTNDFRKLLKQAEKKRTLSRGNAEP